MNVLDEAAGRYGGVSTNGGMHMTARLGSCQLAIRAWSTEATDWSPETGMTNWTLVVARPAFPEFSVEPRRFFDRLFGGRGISLGDEDFDGHFMVTGSDPLAVRRVWSRDTMTRMLDSFSTGSLSSKQQELSLYRGRLPSTIEDVVSGIELLRMLASSDVLGLAALGAIPDAKLDRGGALFPDGVRVGPLVIEGQAITRAIATSAAAASWIVEVVDGTATARDLECLPFEARARVSSLGTARVSSINGEAQVRWKTIETDPTRLAAAIAILRALARAPSLGAFR
ncbi:MAG: hypothetical protein HOV81_20920 [Kofleriaceae bacterium]|nr:hypothetical protein [Kofleriaceae bacterium]